MSIGNCHHNIKGTSMIIFHYTIMKYKHTRSLNVDNFQLTLYIYIFFALIFLIYN